MNHISADYLRQRVAMIEATIRSGEANVPACMRALEKLRDQITAIEPHPPSAGTEGGR